MVFLKIILFFVLPAFLFGLSLCTLIFTGFSLNKQNTIFKNLSCVWTKRLETFFLIHFIALALYFLWIVLNNNPNNLSLSEVLWSVLLSLAFLALIQLLLFRTYAQGLRKKLAYHFHFVTISLIAFSFLVELLILLIFRTSPSVIQSHFVITEAGGPLNDLIQFSKMILPEDSYSQNKIVHILSSGILSSALFVFGWHSISILKHKKLVLSKAAGRVSLVIFTLFSLGQIFTGHYTTIEVSVNQPHKLASYEAHFDGNSPADLYILGWVDDDKKTVKGIGIDGGLSFLLSGQFDAPIKALNNVQQDDLPQHTNFIFQNFHLMILIGLWCILLSSIAIMYWWNGTLFKRKPILKILAFSTPLPFIASVCGWLASLSAERNEYWVQFAQEMQPGGFMQSNTSEIAPMLAYAVFILITSYIAYQLIRKTISNYSLSKTFPVLRDRCGM